MNNKLLTYVVLIISCFVLVGCSSKNKDNNQNANNDNLIPNNYHAYSTETCNMERDFYFKNGNYNYYKVCLKYVELDFKDIKLIRDLKDAMANNETTLENLISKSNNKMEFNNFVVYRYDNFILAIKDNDVFLIDDKVNYEEYLLNLWIFGENVTKSQRANRII